MNHPRFSIFGRRFLRGSVLLRNAAAILIVGVIGVASFTGFAFYRDRIADNLAWSQNVRVERESRLVTRIFEMGKASSFIALNYDKNTGRLMINSPPCENSILDAPSGSGRSGQSAALALLCSSPQGAEVRAEIEAWNTSYDFLAVRDNRSQNDSCQNSNEPGEVSRLKVEVYVPYGCKPNEWRVERVIGDSSVPITWMAAAEPPFSEFNFLVDPQEPMIYAGDWARVSPDSYSDGTTPSRYRLTTKSLRLSAGGVVSIDVVGRLRSIKIDGDTFNINTQNREANWRWSRKAGGVYVRAWLLCNPDDVDEDSQNGEDDEEGEDDPDCSEEPPAKDKVRFAYQIDLSQFPRDLRVARPRGPRNIDIVIEAESNTQLPRSMRPSNRGAGLRLTRHLRADCTPGWLNAPNPAANCDLKWTRVEGVEAPPPRSIRRIVIGEGTRTRDLVDPKTGVISTDAFDRGFAPIVGFGPHDWGSLVATLASRGSKSGQQTTDDGEPFALTIDQRIQDAAYESLATYQGCQSLKSKGRRSKSLPLCRKLHDAQTATLVVVDAEQKPGEIRALATLPTPPRKLHMWDLAALDEGNDFLPAGLGWRAAARDNVPGSTFKAVTSVAAITAATSSEANAQFAKDISDLLRGNMDLNSQIKLMGLAYAPRSGPTRPGTRRPPCTVVSGQGGASVNTIPVPNAARPIWCARNFGGAAYWAPRSPTQSHCPTSGRGTQLGMCEALMISSNLFFGGVGQQLVRFDSPSDPLALRTARRLTFGANIQAPVVGVTPPKEVRRRFDLTRGSAPSPKLSADPISMAATSRQQRRDHPDAVIRSGFGDDVQATPLAIATVYASVGLGKIVRPAIVPLARNQGCPVAKADDDECGPLIPPGARGAGPLTDSLRAGLHAVAAVQGGTANAAFRTSEGQTLLRNGDKPRLFLKTGTATVINGKRFSLWTAGWIDGVPGTNIPTRLSFACFLTHRGNADTGGANCAPLIRDFLLRLNRTNLVR